MKRPLVIGLLFLVLQLQAQVRIGEREAISSAERFLVEHAKQQSPTLNLSHTIHSNLSRQPNLFVFSLEPQGFVIVSAMDEVLAYSLESNLSTSDELPTPATYWIDLYNERTDYLAQHPDQFKELPRNPRAVEPMLTSRWGQGCYYNEACPVDASGPCQHVPAGCSAVAMAQIMYYHKYPTTGIGETTYPSTYGSLSANFTQTTYRWDRMADSLSYSNPWVAQLISHCGISVKMAYSTHGSVASNSSVKNAFQQHFFYPTATRSLRTDYTDEAWLSMIKADLDNNCPVYYTGSSDQGGHAFVCDGYDENGLFHFNFGWEGTADGYYTIDDPSGFSLNQIIIHNICPATDNHINSDEHGIIYVAADGTGNGSSWEQATGNFQLALCKSHLDGCSIWVKEGAYQSNPSEDQAFLLLQNCCLYGGFRGDEPYDYDLSQRDFESHPSILDGNQKQRVIGFIDNSAPGSVLIDGFTIQNGKAFNGGGLFLTCNAQIKNCKFCFNQARSNGGGVYCEGDIQQCQFIKCIFSNNKAQKNGGGIATAGAGLTLLSCLINNNTAKTGGGCYAEGKTKLFNCTITKNEAQDDFGGIYYPQSTSQNLIKNCIIWGNDSQGEYDQIGPMNTYSYCAIEGDMSASGLNFNADSDNDGTSPKFYIRFQNPNVVAGDMGEGGNWRLQPNSLCIDRVASTPLMIDTDLDGNPRLRHNGYDLGAYETNTAASFTDYYCGDEAFQYLDTLLSGIGIYTFLYPDISYDSLVVIEIHPVSNSSVNLTEVICEGETYDFGGIPLNQPGQYTAYENCLEYHLDLIVKPFDTISLEKEICESNYYDFFGTPLTESGHYSTTVDCDTYLLDLNVSPWSIIQMDDFICEGDTYDFFGTTLHNKGHFSKIVGCNMYDLNLMGRPAPKLRCSRDTIVGYGEHLELTASGADTYLWSTGDTTESIAIFPIVDRTYYVTGFSNDGCSAMDSITVRVNNLDGKISMYPNPASDKATIYLPLIDEVEVFNLYGERITDVEAHRKAVELDVTPYPNGIYIVHVRCLYKHYYAKLIVKH